MTMLCRICFLSCLILLSPDATWCFSLSEKKTATKAKCGGPTIAVIGGGPSGVFAAVTAASKLHESGLSLTSVTIYEASDTLLQSLKRREQLTILEDPTKKIRELLIDGYPRGQREITAVMTKTLSPIMQQRWFEERGVEFVSSCSPECGGSISAADPKMVIAALEQNEYMTGIDAIHVKLGEKVTQIIQTHAAPSSSSLEEKARSGNKFRIISSNTNNNDGSDKSCDYDCIILATGSSFQGYQLAKSLGHTVIAPARSLFGFTQQLSLIKNQQQQKKLFEELSVIDNNNDNVKTPITAPYCRVSFKIKPPGQKRPRVYKSLGPVTFGTFCDDNDNNKYNFVTGKAPQHLSSFAAKELKECNYKGKLFIHFCPEIYKVEDVYERLWTYRQDNSSDLVTKKCPLEYRQVDYDNYDFETDTFAVFVSDSIPCNLWKGVCQMACGGGFNTENTTWGNLSPKKVRSLADTIVACPFEFTGRLTPSVVAAAAGNKDAEDHLFVNAGGVSLKELEMTKLSSKFITDSVFLCGRLLDTDGSSIGYNRMIDWVTGYTAGLHAANHILYKTKNHV